jgi:hypothetical protein
MPVGDPLRQYLAEFLQAAIRAKCGAAWAAIGGGTDVCNRVDTNDPNDNTFSTTGLPCIIVMRGERDRKVRVIAEEIKARISKVHALWIPPLAVQNWKAHRESFLQAVEAAIIDGIERDRIPTWKRTGDTDVATPTMGSSIVRACRVLRPLDLEMSFEDSEVTVQMRDAEAKKYPCLKATFTVWEAREVTTTGAVNTVTGTHRTNGDTTTDYTETLPIP